MTPQSHLGLNLRRLVGRFTSLFARPAQTAERGRRARRARLRVEELEPRVVPSTIPGLNKGLVQFSFGTSTSRVPAGYTKVTPILFNNTRGYGFQTLTDLTAQDRRTADPLTRAFVRAKNDTFLVNLPNGTYDVTPTLGDAIAVRGPTKITLDGQVVASSLVAAPGQFVHPTYRVQVTNGRLSLNLAEGVGTNPRWALNALTIQVIAVSANAGSQYVAAPGATIAFSGSATETGVAYPSGLTFSWTFGDGSTGTGANPTHAYTNPGTYAVALTVTDPNNGATGSATASAVIKAVPPTGKYIVTPWDTIPDFGANPTITTIASGSWSDPTIWSLGRVPTDADIVDILAGNTVSYDVASTAHLNTIEVQSGGTLNFRTDISTEVVVGNILVLDGGTLTVGTPSNPVSASVTATIVIANQAINTTTDPEQYGTGIIGLGTVTMCGAAKNSTFSPLATEAHAGDTTLTLASPISGWRVGDKLFLPDTRQLKLTEQPRNNGYVPQYEFPVLAGISADGKTLTLASPLQFDHLGARDPNGNLRFLPHVGDIDSNVLVISENDDNPAAGQVTRGYVMLTGRAQVDIRYVHFDGMGRTTVDQVDNTTFDATGAVTHIGTNEGERVPLELRHLIGPQTAPANGYQYTLIGNSVGCDDAMNQRWAINLNDAQFGLIQDNFIHLMAGAGIVAETAAETGNVIDHNFIAGIAGDGERADGRGERDIAFEGSGIWMRGFSNYVRNNVTADVAFGYTYFAFQETEVMVPPTQGADESQYVLVNMNRTALQQFANNTGYGGAMQTGAVIWFLGSNSSAGVYANAPASTVLNLTVWHAFQYAYYGYESSNVTLEGYTAIDDPSVLSNPSETSAGIYHQDYVTDNLTLDHADIEGFRGGYVTPSFGTGTLTIENSTFKNCVNITVQVPNSPGSDPDSTTLPGKTTLINNDKFALLSGDMGGVAEYNINMYVEPGLNTANFLVANKVFVTNYNGVAGDNFQVFFKEQAANGPAVPVTSGTRLIGAPVAGLSNGQLFAQFGVAFAGAVAPATATTEADIFGLVQAD